MSSTQHHLPTTLAYVRSLLELANESNSAQQIGEELHGLDEILDGYPAFVSYISDPAVGTEERAGVLKRGLGGAISPLLSKFLGVLNANNRLGLLREIASAYRVLLDEQLGKVEVDITVARQLQPDELERVRQRISDALKKQALIHQEVDESIIGGLVLRVKDQMIDASVRYQLEAMKRQLLMARPK